MRVESSGSGLLPLCHLVRQPVGVVSSCRGEARREKMVVSQKKGEGPLTQHGVEQLGENEAFGEVWQAVDAVWCGSA